MTLEDLQNQLSEQKRIVAQALEEARATSPTFGLKWRETIEKKHKAEMEITRIKGKIDWLYREQLQQKCLAGESITIAPQETGWTEQDCFHMTSFWDLVEYLLDAGELWFNEGGTLYFTTHYD